MLPDFTIGKAAINEKLQRYINASVSEFMGPFATIPERRIVEGLGFAHGIAGEKPVDIPLANHRHEMTFDIDEVKNLPVLFWVRMEEMARGIAAQRVIYACSEIQKATETAGNHMKGEKITPQVLLNMYRKIDISFNIAGMPVMPDILTFSDAMHQEFNLAIEELMSTPDLKQELDNIIEQKKQIWNDRESRRKLAD